MALEISVGDTEDSQYVFNLAGKDRGMCVRIMSNGNSNVLWIEAPITEFPAVGFRGSRE